MKSYRITFQPIGKAFSAPEGENILNLANKSGIDIPSICNGERLCGKCVIKISDGIQEPKEIERKFFSEKEIIDGLRLACKTKIDRDLTIWLVNEKEIETIKILTTGLELPIPIKSDFYKIKLELEKPSLENQFALLESLKNKISEKINHIDKDSLQITYSLLQNLDHILEKNEYKVTAVINGNEIVDIKDINENDNCIAIAIDLGTTTIVGLLIDLIGGKTIQVASRTNPQINTGADVITRVNYTINEVGGLQKLSSAAIEAINEIIEEICLKAGIHPGSIYQLSLAGNAIMNHIFLNVNPKSMAFAPYLPVYKDTVALRSKEIGVKINPDGKTFVLPNISGFVGGDIVGLILAHSLLDKDKITLGLDIGTNGEIVLGSRKRLLCCATAAGPAFEGGHISNGMRASAGAIDKVSIYDYKLHYHVIDNIEPKGICGTGLIDLVAGLLEYEVIDETGKILGKDDLSEKGKLFIDRIVPNGYQNDFIIAFENEKNNDKQILLKQKDVRELQLAKGAIAAGISILLSELGITKDEIDEVLIAGAFGSYINKESALRIGIIPKVDIKKVKSVGNSASIGAKQYLLSTSKRDKSKVIIKKTEYIELCTIQEFQDKFMEEMVFNSK